MPTSPALLSLLLCRLQPRPLPSGEVDCVQGMDGGWGPSPPVASARLPANHVRYVFWLFQGLQCYILPLVLVYFAEYFINQGLVSEGTGRGVGIEIEVGAHVSPFISLSGLCCSLSSSSSGTRP